ncbi:MAG: hypothetical protein QN152_00960 [Armatimonadota bacterium]|nr:hypothetical protein [Armatimonadota bacterium]MDR7538087.1 hypothetical protein [Armatimonadota bacterium]
MEEVVGVGVVVRQLENFFTLVTVEGSHHVLVGDEPVHSGGTDRGPSPFNLFLAALGT